MIGGVDPAARSQPDRPQLRSRGVGGRRGRRCRRSARTRSSKTKCCGITRLQRRAAGADGHLGPRPRRRVDDRQRHHRRRRLGGNRRTRSTATKERAPPAASKGRPTSAPARSAAAPTEPPRFGRTAGEVPAGDRDHGHRDPRERHRDPATSEFSGCATYAPPSTPPASRSPPSRPPRPQPPERRSNSLPRAGARPGSNAASTARPSTPAPRRSASPASPPVPTPSPSAPRGPPTGARPSTPGTGHRRRPTRRGQPATPGRPPWSADPDQRRKGRRRTRGRQSADPAAGDEEVRAAGRTEGDPGRRGHRRDQGQGPLTSIGPDGTEQSAAFFGGVFRVKQRKATGLVVLELLDTDVCPAPSDEQGSAPARPTAATFAAAAGQRDQRQALGQRPRQLPHRRQRAARRPCAGRSGWSKTAATAPPSSGPAAGRPVRDFSSARRCRCRRARPTSPAKVDPGGSLRRRRGRAMVVVALVAAAVGVVFYATRLLRHAGGAERRRPLRRPRHPGDAGRNRRRRGRRQDLQRTGEHVAVPALARGQGDRAADARPGPRRSRSTSSSPSRRRRSRTTR